VPSMLAGNRVQSHERNPRTPTPFRPVQYLGNKLRALHEIALAAHEMVGANARIADLFSGSSVVSQSLALEGHQVSAVDTQRYAKVFASATLGIGRHDGDEVEIGAIERTANQIQQTWGEWNCHAEAERRLLAGSDADGLKKLYESLPSCWRSADHVLYQRIADGGDATFDAPLISEIYAGSYFGIAQALEIDALRHAIEHHSLSGTISPWHRQALLTALMSAMSSAVHSAGKHFAQHLLSGSSQNHRFLNRRLLDDRRLQITKLVSTAARALNDLPFRASDGHDAIDTRAEDFASKDAGAFDLIYLDPPYTAQQYSRFYHLLETIVSYRWPALLHSGQITAGLYPRDRFKSAFSSKTKALGAFRSIAASASSGRTGLLISYSQSHAASDRNARMISLEDLLATCREFYGAGQVTSARLSHRYRQFNSSHHSNSLRNDPEILIQCNTR
jgi:adenine-specific DNA-methyltransferase